MSSYFLHISFVQVQGTRLSHTAFNSNHRSHFLHHPGRLTQRHTPLGDILSDHRACSNRTSLPNGDARQNHDIRANPTIVAYGNRLRVLDIIAPALHLRLVRSGEQGDVGSEHDTVTDRDEGTIKDGEVEVRVEALAEVDVAAIIDVEGGFDVGIVVCDLADDLFDVR